MVRTEKSKGNKVLNKTNRIVLKTKRTKKRKLKKDVNELNTATSQTFKTKHGETTIDDKQLKNSSTKKHFFSKYEIGDILKEGGNGIVFKGKYTSIDQGFLTLFFQFTPFRLIKAIATSNKTSN